jgi:hypothetical protein
MKKVENIRLKLNDIRSDLKKFNHDILIQRNMLNKKAEAPVSIDVPIYNKMKVHSNPNLPLISNGFLDLKSIKLEKYPTFFCKGFIYCSIY